MKKIFHTLIFSGLLVSLLSMVSPILVQGAECPPDQICNPLKYGTFEELVNAIIGFLIKVGIPLATVMFVISGILFVTSGGDPNRVSTAKKFMLYTAIGFAVILISSGLIKVLQSLLGASS